MFKLSPYEEGFWYTVAGGFWKAAFIILILLSLFTPTAESQTQEDFFQNLFGDNEGRTETYPIASNMSAEVGTWGGTVDAFRLDTRTVVSQTWSILILSHYTVDLDTGGTWRYAFDIDDNEICSWVVTSWNPGLGVGTDPKSVQTNIPLCRLAAPAFGTHTFNVTRTVESGTPDTIENALTTIQFINTDVMIESDSMPTQFETATGATAFEFGAWILLLALAFGLIVSKRGAKDRTAMCIASAVVAVMAIFVSLNVFNGVFLLIGFLLPIGVIGIAIDTMIRGGETN